MAQPGFTQELAQYVFPPAHFDGVCLEADDAQAVATFWRLVLQGTIDDLGGGRYRVDPAPGRPSSEIVRVNPTRTPNPHGKRVHFDVRLPGPDPRHLLAAGARLVKTPDEEPWYVLTDPEGNDLCAYPAVDERPSGIFELVVKCRDARAQAHWWARALGGRVEIEGEAAAVVGAPHFPWDYLLFDPVPEPKVTRNRMHWHVVLRDPEPAALTDAGATVLRAPVADNTSWVLADPEGNEFCAVPQRR